MRVEEGVGERELRLVELEKAILTLDEITTRSVYAVLFIPNVT